jgi:DNA-binding FadR family transcriptional regulator
VNSISDQPTGRRVFEVVVDEIRREVADGTLAPGHKLPAERELAAKLGVSRAAVREALRSLEASGVLEFRKGVYGGAFIRHASAAGLLASTSDMLALGSVSIEHLSEVRSALLSLAVRLACSRATVRDLVLIEENLEMTAALEEGESPDALVNVLTDFYLLIGNASHNAILAIFIEAVTDVAHDLLQKTRPGAAPGLSAMRRGILEAIRVRDADAAEAAMARHMAMNQEYYLSHGGDELLRSNE